MSSYIDVPIDTNPDTLAELAYTRMQARFPGWSPAVANLDTVMIESMAMVAAEMRDVSSRVPRTVFRTFGATVMNLPPIDSVAATGQTTWTMIDNKGYTIPAGALIGLRAAGDVLVPFRVVNTTVIAPGQTATAAGAVYIQAIDTGIIGNGLTGPAELVDALDYVVTIATTAPTSGGQDAEDDDEYLSRLVEELRLLSPTPILPQDFAVLTVSEFPSVARAIAIDGYNPAGGTYNNERMVAVCAIDENGNAVSTQIKSEIDAYLQSLREINFVVNMIDPTYTTIAVSFAIKILPGFGIAPVVDDVESALTEYLSPNNWGLIESGAEWQNIQVVRYLEIAAAINAVSGVDYVSSLTLGLQGGALAAADYALTGAVPLPRPGTMTGSSI